MSYSTTENIEDIIQWDVKNWSKALFHWDKSVNWSNVKHSLELGGRQGGVSLWLAQKGKQVICSDLDGVQVTAQPLHQKHKVTEYITYQDIDACNIPYENHFDIIVFKSIIGGVGSNDNHEKQKEVFKQIHKALKPGGKLLYAENLIASPLHQQMRKRFISWGNRWRYVSVSEMHDFLKDFNSYDLNTTGVLATFGRSEKQRKLLAQVDQWVFNHLCPKNWRYISYGVAEK